MRKTITLTVVFGFSITAQAISTEAFKKHVIDGEFAGGYQVSVADINKDGKPDVIALSTTPSQLVWYKNPAWERHVITAATQGNIDVAPYDIDKDGDQDLALAYEFNLEDPAKGKVAWLECPPDPVSSFEWKLHPIASVGASHRVRWATLGDTKTKWLINQPIVGPGAKASAYSGATQFQAFPPPAAPTTDAWKPATVDSTLELAHAMFIAQYDEDPQDEIITASKTGVNVFDPDASGAAFKKQLLHKGHEGKFTGSSEVAFGKLDVQQMRFVAAIEPWHGNEVVVYEIGEPVSMGEARYVIDDQLKDGHALACFDVDNDGNDEIVAGGRGGDRALRIYQWSPGIAEFEITLIDEGHIGAAGIFIADINQDGNQDIVATGTPTHNVVWYENVPPRE